MEKNVGLSSGSVNPDIDCLILVEGVDDKAQPPRNDSSQKIRLENLLLNHLVSTLPSVAIRTLRCSSIYPIEKIVSYTSVGIPVLFLDLRPRSSPQAGETDREKVMEAALTEWRHSCKACYEDCGSECYDACSLAFFYDLLYGDGDPNQTSASKSFLKQGAHHGEWLFESICRRQKNEAGRSQQMFPGPKHIQR
eukprot:997518-Rhodomonas_salina.1